MKALYYDELEIGNLYTTIRQRTYPRKLIENLSTNKKCGDIYPQDAFVVLEMANILKENFSEKWIKILTTQGVIGWAYFIEAFDSEPPFLELKP